MLGLQNHGWGSTLFEEKHYTAHILEKEKYENFRLVDVVPCLQDAEELHTEHKSICFPLDILFETEKVVPCNRVRLWCNVAAFTDELSVYTVHRLPI
jgi:hypothetical protein